MVPEGMSRKPASTAVQDGTALLKALGLIVLSVPLAAGGFFAMALLGHWVWGAPLWAAALAAVWKSRPALVREQRLQDEQSGHPIEVYYTGEGRTDCPCCGYPTWTTDTDSCLLCDWSNDIADISDDEIPIAEARQNFGRSLTVYGSKHRPEWSRDMSAAELELKRKLIAAYADATSGGDVGWFRVRSLEDRLRDAQYRNL